MKQKILDIIEPPEHKPETAVNPQPKTPEKTPAQTQTDDTVDNTNTKDEKRTSNVFEKIFWGFVAVITILVVGYFILGPSDLASTSHFNKAKEYQNRGDYVLALAEYDAAIELNPKYAEAYYERGHLYFKQSQYSDAVNSFKKAIKFGDKNFDAYYWCGKACLKDKQYNDAIDNFTYAINVASKIKLDLWLVEAYKSRAGAYDHTKKYDLAINDYSEVIKISPNDADAYNARGVVYDHKGDNNRALADFEKAAKLDPKQELYKKNIQIIRERMGL